MKNLILLRHGEAAMADSRGRNFDDFERRLTQVGAAQVSSTAGKIRDRLIQEKNYLSNVSVITSPLMRTVQTGDIVKNVLGIKSKDDAFLEEITAESDVVEAVQAALFYR